MSSLKQFTGACHWDLIGSACVRGYKRSGNQDENQIAFSEMYESMTLRDSHVISQGQRRLSRWAFRSLLVERPWDERTSGRLQRTADCATGPFSSASVPLADR
ncbi:hypothetical protein MRX96_024576 [Rhipicephalus microplus]